MGYPIYYVEAGDTLPVLFDSFDGGTGASITMTGLATTDIEIFKDGGATTRSSDSGYTLLDTDGIDFASITGIHGFSIDLSDNSDAGFFAVGSWYHVVISSITVDSQTVNFVACAFRIVSATRGMAGTALPDAAADAAGGLPVSDAGGLDLDALDTQIDAIETDTQDIQSRLPAALVGGLMSCDVTAISTSTTAANNAETCFTGTITTFDALDTAQDTQHSTTQTAIAIAQSDLDTLTGADGATLATSQPNYAPATQADVGVTTGTGGLGSSASAMSLKTPNLTAANQYVGATIRFNTDTVTAQLRGQCTTIVASSIAGTDNFTMSPALSTAPADDEAFTIHPSKAGFPLLSIDSSSTQVARVGADGDTLETLSDEIAALNNLSAAQVNAEVVDALATDTYAEPGQGTPAATATLAAKVNYLYKAWRNKTTQTATQYSLFADDASTVDQKATVSDDGTTTTVGEIATGP